MSKKWFLVFKREYSFRVRKKSFIIMTLLMPLIFAIFIFLPVYVMDSSMSKKSKVIVIDNSGEINLSNSDNVEFEYSQSQSIKDIPQEAKEKYSAILFIPKDVESEQAVIYLLSDKNIKIAQKIKFLYQIAIEDYRYKKFGINRQLVEKIKTEAKVQVLKWTEQGATVSSVSIKFALATFGALLLYFFIFMYGGLAMRSVMEEKVNRVVELIVSSVRPIELMFGKLLAILFVAITQFFIWFVFIILILFASKFVVQVQDSNVIMLKLESILDMIKQVNIWFWLLTFVFFFLSGYLFFGSWFAAIGSAIDVETDAQQFVLPLSLPLIFAIIFMQPILYNPDGQLAFWMSIIPFTSPIIMPMRISFGIGDALMWWELILSMVLMILAVWASLWASAKIFRIGILFYGKKLTYKDLWKWIRQT